MMLKQVKLGLIAAVLLLTTLGTDFRATAYPKFLKQAEKFGAQDCLYCHQRENGGEGWNARGQWLLDEKDKRKADDIDIDWLENYKGKETDKSNDKDKEPNKDQNKDEKKEPAKKPIKTTEQKKP